jgi:uncharacterized delta-60 repeat protein
MCAARLASQSLEALESRVLFAAGDLDPTFAGGIVTRDISPSGDFGFALAVQSDGKVLMGGRAHMGVTGNDFAIARFNADGSIDTTFGNNGVVITNMGHASDGVYALKVLSDGKIVAVGETTRNGMGLDFAVARYNGNGTLDTTFDTDGKAYADFGNSMDQARSVAISGTGQIIVAGTATISSSPRVALVAFTSNGALDTTFGTNGKVTTTYAPGYARGASVAVLGNGSIVVAGSAFNFSAGAGDFLAVKYTSTGTLDTTFGTAGIALVDFGYDESAHAMSVQTDGKLTLAGEQFNSDTNASDMAVTRLNANGTLDGGFGAITTDFDGDYDAGMSVTVQSDGRVVVGGIATVGGVSHFGLARYNSDGTLDSNFKSGRVALAIGSEAVANAVTLDGDGNIVVAGFSGNAGNYSFAAARVISRVNAAPTANPGSGYSVDEGGSVAIDGSSSFDSDGSIVSHEWDLDYDGVTFDTDATGAAATFSAAGLNGPMARTIALRVTDNEGATHVMTTTVTINDVPPPPEPEPEPEPTPDPVPGSAVLSDDTSAPGKKVLTVYGTSQGDKLSLRTSKGKLMVMLGRKSLGTFDGNMLSQIVMYGSAGNDCIDAHNSPVPVMLFGGDGCDAMMGSKFGDVLIGGDADDNLFGFKGNDVMVGGAGRDKLHSVLGDDLMVGDGLTFENSMTEMKALLNTWTMTKTPGDVMASVVDDKVKDKFHCASRKDCVIDTPEQMTKKEHKKRK